MSPSLKRKGSPNLATSEESSKRRLTADTTANPTLTDENDTLTSQPTPAEPQPTNTTTTSHPAQIPSSPSTTTPTDPRAARFAALRSLHQKSRQANLTETKSEAQRSAIDPSALSSLQRKRDLASHKLLQASTTAAGEDFERKRAWDWTAEESARWDERQAQKAQNRGDVAFQDYAREAGKVYARQVAGMEKGEGGEERRREYERAKKEAVERAVGTGELQVIETEEGELVAVDRKGVWGGAANGFAENRPSRAAVDRLVDDLRKAEEVRMKKRRERGRAEDSAADVSYINEKNKQFNLKLARFYNKYTADIRESFERGSAI